MESNMETKKMNRLLLTCGISAATLLATGFANAAVLMNQPAYSSAHVDAATNSCATAEYGSLWNANCDSLGAQWALPMNQNSTARHVVRVKSGAEFSTSFSCAVWPLSSAYNNYFLDYPTTITFTAANQTQSVTLRSGATSGLVTCTIPRGDSVAGMSWVQ